MYKTRILTFSSRVRAEMGRASSRAALQPCAVLPVSSYSQKFLGPLAKICDFSLPILSIHGTAGLPKKVTHFSLQL